MPFETGSLDAVFSSFTLELFDTPDIPVVLGECRRALRDGGRLCVVAMSKQGKLALMLCVEICSAAYVYNRKMSTAVVNSLFGDGAGAVVVRQDDADSWCRGPIVAD